MLETIRVRRAGFSLRTNFDSFLHRYILIAPETRAVAAQNPGEACRCILKTCKDVPADLWQIGKTKVFAKGSVEATMEQKRALKIMVFVCRIQAFCRMVNARNSFLRMKKSILVLQKMTRGFLARNKHRKIKKGIIRTQALWRGYYVRNQYREKLKKKNEERMKREEETTKKEKEEVQRYEEVDPDEQERLAREEELVKYLESTESERMSKADNRVKSSKRPTNKKEPKPSFPSELRRKMVSYQLPLIGPLHIANGNFVRFNPESKTRYLHFQVSVIVLNG
jgi:myosin heavy subunit